MELTWVGRIEDEITTNRLMKKDSEEVVLIANLDDKIEPLRKIISLEHGYIDRACFSEY